MPHSLFIFRFDDQAPTEQDLYIFNAVSIKGIDSVKLKTTPFGYVALIKTELNVKALNRRFKRIENKHNVRLPIFIMDLTSPKVECEGTYFRIGDLSPNCIRRRQLPKKNVENAELKSDEILEKIYDKGMSSITKHEMGILDELSSNLRNAEK